LDKLGDVLVQLVRAVALKEYKMDIKNRKVAVFIDAENVSAQHIDNILSEASNYGDVIIKRVFADWSSQLMKSWIEKISSQSLKPEQQFSAVKGKNASDISLIVSVLTALFEKNIDVFCLVSNDSDFTRLVQELREREKTVVGFGTTQSVPAVFVNSFSEFIYLDTNKGKKLDERTGGSKLPKDRISALRDIIEMLIERNGKALYNVIMMEMRNKFADFIPKNYGSETMSDFMKKNLSAIGKYEIKTDKDKSTRYLVRGS